MALLVARPAAARRAGGRGHRLFPLPVHCTWISPANLNGQRIRANLRPARRGDSGRDSQPTRCRHSLGETAAPFYGVLASQRRLWFHASHELRTRYQPDHKP